MARARDRVFRFRLATFCAFLLAVVVICPWPHAAAQQSHGVDVTSKSGPSQRILRQKPNLSALQGRVLDRDGLPVPGLVVSLRPTQTTCAHTSTYCSVTDGDGIFRLLGLTPQTYPFAIYAKGKRIFSKSAVMIGPGQIVTVQIKLGFSMPEGRASVIPFHPEAVKTSSYHELSRRSMNDGTILPPIPRLPNDRQLYREMPA